MSSAIRLLRYSVLVGTSPSRAMISESFAFEKGQSAVIQRHISSIYGPKELDKNGTCAKNDKLPPPQRENVLGPLLQSRRRLAGRRTNRQ